LLFRNHPSATTHLHIRLASGRAHGYKGDNLRADLQEARRWHGWHTGCIINEVEREVTVQHTENFQELHFLRSRTRQFITDMQLALESERRATRASSLTLQDAQLVRHLQSELSLINSAMSVCFNKQFGGIFRTDGHPSLFALAVKRYADIYMKDVNCLLSYNPNHQFFPTWPYHMVYARSFVLCSHFTFVVFWYMGFYDYIFSS
jgi:hypothetical protein